MRFSDDDIQKFLPLPTATFHILMAVVDSDRHGYSIIQDVVERTGGRLRLSAGTLYRSVQRMLDQGLLTEPRTRPAPRWRARNHCQGWCSGSSTWSPRTR